MTIYDEDLPITGECEKVKPAHAPVEKVKPKPTTDERLGALEWKMDILCKAILRLEGIELPEKGADE